MNFVMVGLAFVACVGLGAIFGYLILMIAAASKAHDRARWMALAYEDLVVRLSGHGRTVALQTGDERVRINECRAAIRVRLLRLAVRNPQTYAALRQAEDDALPQPLRTMLSERRHAETMAHRATGKGA